MITLGCGITARGIMRGIVCGVLGVVSLVLVASRESCAEAPAASSSSTPAKETGERLSIPGQLRDAQEKPIAGAKLWLAVSRSHEVTFDGPTVLARAESDGAGDFVLAPLKSSQRLMPRNDSTQYQIWVWKPGYELGIWTFLQDLPTAAVEIRLQPEPVAEYLIRNVDGSPAAGATVKATLIEKGKARFNRQPTELFPLLERKTGADGRVRLAGLTRKEIRALEISSAEGGAQYHSNENSVPEVVTLMPTGSLEGELQFPGGKAPDVSQLRIRISTILRDPPNADKFSSGMALVTPDRQGRFLVPKIGAGMIMEQFRYPEEFPFRSPPLATQDLKAGANVKLVLPLKAAVKVTRQIREVASQEPLSGIGVHLASRDSLWTITDSRGEFSAWLIPEVRYHTVYDVPEDIVVRYSAAIHETRIPQNAAGRDLPPVELIRGRTVTGFVVSPTGERMAGVTVAINWNDPQETFGVSSGDDAIRGRIYPRTDEKGMFRVKNVLPGVEVTMTAMRSGVRLANTLTVAPKEHGPYRIKTFPLDFISLKGKVVDRAGRGMPETEIELRLRAPGEAKGRVAERIVTDANGEWETPKYLPRDYQYQLRLPQYPQRVRSQRDKLVGESTAWEQTNAGRLADLVVERVGP